MATTIAKTGRTVFGFTLAPHSNEENQPAPEKAGQTFPIGCVLQKSGGYLIGTGSGVLTTGWGISIDEGQDLANDGDDVAACWRFSRHERYVGTLNGVLAVTDDWATIAQASGVPTLTAVASGEANKRAHIIGPAPGWNIGDTNARVIFQVTDAFCEQGGGL